MARAKAGAVLLVEEAGENLLLDAGWITGRHLPAVGQIDGVELLVLFLDGHHRALLQVVHRFGADYIRSALWLPGVLERLPSDDVVVDVGGGHDVDA